MKNNREPITYIESAAIWWGIFWRSIAVGIIPLVILYRILAQTMEVSDVTLIIQILYLPIIIYFQQRVINKKVINVRYEKDDKEENSE